MESEQEIIDEISKYTPYEDFLRTYGRILELEKEEDAKLEALSNLQKAFLSASTDAEREYVKQTVGQIRELSKAARAELRALRTEMIRFMPLETAKDLYRRLELTRQGKGQ
ncbi:MAG TPA: hypothetical protein VI958_04200 [Acidobacteriota bacterium]